MSARAGKERTIGNEEDARDDSPRHSPGVALLCDVGVGWEYRLGGGGAGGPCGGCDGARFTRTGAGLTNLMGVAAELRPRTPPMTMEPF